MIFGLNVTFVGMVVVFVALILLSLIIWAISKALHSMNGGGKAGLQENIPAVSAYAPGNNVPDGELIAVLTAAVAAAMKNEPGVKIRVASFRRIPQNTPVWNKAGRLEYISGKL